MRLWIVLEQVKETVRAAYEVWMVRVNCRIFYLKEVHNHVGRRRKALVQHVLHHVADLGLELVEVGKLGHVCLDHDLAQLFIYQVRAIERGLKQSGYLLSDEHLEGAFGHEETWRHG